jgi:hypothetical protein
MPIVQQLPGALWIAPSSEALQLAPPALGQLFDPFGQAPTVEAWATDQGFANGMSHALGGLSPQVRADFKANNPAVHDSVTSLGAILHAVGGVVEGATMEVATARAVAQVVTKIATGVASMASEMGGQVSAAVANMGAAIPLIGAYVAAIIDVVEAATYPEVTASEAETARRRWISYCRGVVNDGDPVGTGSLGKVEPADLFRDVLFSRVDRSGVVARVQRSLPANIGSIMVLLCGDAAVGYGVTPELWALDVPRMPGMKIPRATRQSMWKLIQAMMAAVRDPDAFPSQIAGDNGRAMMPLLSQILADQFVRGNWTIETARWLVDYRILKLRARSFRIPGEGIRAGSVAVDMPACSAAGFDLGGTFFQFVKGWQTCVLEGDCSAQRRPPRRSAALLSLGRNATRFMLERDAPSEAPSVAPAALTVMALAGAIMARRLGL